MAWQSSTINPATTNPAADISKITNDLQQLRGVIGGTPDVAIPSVWTTPTNVLAQTANSATTAGTSTAYTLAPAQAITSYAAGQTFWVTFHAASGANPTLQVSGVASPPTLVRQAADGTYVNIAANDIPINHRSRVTLLSASQALIEDLPPVVASIAGFKNKIINGAMVIDQRNAGASVTISTAGHFITDRWSANASQNSKYTAQQNAGAVTPPSGFINYLGATSSSAYSVLTGDVFWLAQAIEGLNIADLGWGAAGAQSVTLSFWVRSSLTGTFGGALRNSAGSRSYPFTYSILAANTWEQKTITIAGDTTGTWLTTNGIGINLNFGLGAGSTFSGTAGAWAAGNFVTATGATSVVGTNGATFYITGVQLEAGTNASSFEQIDYGRELMMCQRYFQAASNFIYSTSFARICYMFPVQMRTAPTLAGGGSGFSSSNVTVAGYCAEQTSSGAQSMTFSAEL